MRMHDVYELRAFDYSTDELVLERRDVEGGRVNAQLITVVAPGFRTMTFRKGQKFLVDIQEVKNAKNED